MTEANPQFAKITFSNEAIASDIVDTILGIIHDSLLKEATGDDTDHVLGSAAVEVHSRITHADELTYLSIETASRDENLKSIALATELHSRLALEVGEISPEYDARQHIETNRAAEAADNLIRGVTDELATQAHKAVDKEQRELVVNIIEELGTRVGGGA
ncbi:hypothetical protein [Halorubellus salinus]|uniref:hypothetical protein n=1 Tax=Halorubellus salinus TaxID=755309 RepID=UPI001D0624DD|nr:hypothetical protein [Halorubellus salinus]